MNIGDYNFSEPKLIGDSDSVDKSAVYVVMTRDVLLRWYYIYVGQTKDLSQRFSTHEKWNCWQKNKKNGLYFSCLFMSGEQQRFDIETKLRNNLLWLPCNKQ